MFIRKKEAMAFATCSSQFEVRKCEVRDRVKLPLFRADEDLVGPEAEEAFGDLWKYKESGYPWPWPNATEAYKKVKLLPLRKSNVRKERGA